MNIPSVISDEISQHIDCPGGNAGRLFHGRGKRFDGYSFVTVDRLADHILVTCYDSRGTTESRRLAEALTKSRLTKDFQIWLQDRSTPNITSFNISDPANCSNPEIEIIENGLRYKVKLGANQNIGFFFDSSNLRRDLISNAKGKKILNLFAYTCSYSVAAVAGGAAAVVNVDLSKASLSWGRDNHRLNKQSTTSVTFKSFDILKSLNTIARMGPFDWIIIDPPTNQGSAFNANRDYHKVIRRLDAMISTKGIITACLNDPLEGEDFLIDRFKEYSSAAYTYRTLPNEAFQNQDPSLGLKILNFVQN